MDESDPSQNKPQPETKPSSQQSSGLSLQSPTEATQTAKAKSWLVFTIIAVAILSFGLVGFFAYRNYQLRPRLQTEISKEIATTPKTSPEISETKPTQTASLTENWQTFKSTTEYSYQVDYPANWDITKGDAYNFVRFNDRKSDSYVQLTCPRGAGEHKTTLPNPKEWEPNEGGYFTKYIKYLTINDMEAVQYVWGTENSKKDFLYTALLRKPEPLVCELFTLVAFENGNYPAQIEVQRTYNRIVTSFKFIR